MTVLKPNETVCLVPFEPYNCCFEMDQCMNFCRTEGFCQHCFVPTAEVTVGRAYEFYSTERYVSNSVS
jgi:hypothetical protein